VRRPFDLAKGPLLRAHLIQLDEADHILVLTLHHIVSDGWSLGVLGRELTALYGDFAAGRTPVLPPLPIQYRDYTEQQLEWLQGVELERQLTYWRRQLDGVPMVLELPTDCPRPVHQKFDGASVSVRLSASLLDALRALSRQHDATLFMTLLAAFAVLLSRYTGQEDLVVGTPIAGRRRLPLRDHGLIGFFVNTLALRSDLRGNPMFEDFLDSTRQVALDAYTHQDVPFEKLVELLRPERTLDRSPLFQVLFAMESAAWTTLELPGLDVCPVEASTRTSKFDLSLFVTERADGLDATMNYSTALFEAGTIRRMLGNFETLLMAIVRDPRQRVKRLPVLTAEERAQVLVRWNATERPYPREACLHELIEAQVKRSPDAVAVRHEGTALTYGQVNRRANQVAHRLRKLGVGPDVLVGVCISRSLELVVGVLGVLKAGGAYVPLDPAHPRDRQAFLLADSGASLLLTQASLVSTLPTHRVPVVCLDPDWQGISGESDEGPSSRVTARHPMYVLYTSGSTGQPKGVSVEHRSVVNYLTWVNRVLIRRGAGYLPAVTSLTFDASLRQLFAPLLRGDEVWIPSDANASDPVALLGALASRRRVGLSCVPSLWMAMLAAIERGDGTLPNGSLTTLLLGGEALTDELVRRSVKVLPELEIWNLYGPTEATVNATAARIWPGEVVTIGQPIANTQTYVLDAHEEPVPVGVPGELYIGGNGVARGYLNRPDLTAERFVPNPFGERSGERLYRTGDRVRWLSAGVIEFLGRVDHQVKIRGYRIELGEVEASVAEHPGVAETVVIVREDDPGDKRLVAYVVPRRKETAASGPGVPPSPEGIVPQVRGLLRQKLPEVMVPSVFVLLDRLPLTPNGKVDRRALPVPERPDAESRREGHVKPRNLVEESLARIWAEVLGADQLSIHDDFFELGGHSLLATQVMARVREAFQVDLPLRALFESPTVVGLAQAVELARADGREVRVPLIVPVPRESRRLGAAPSRDNQVGGRGGQ
jgi:amino acid adenylation domain-containing protein